MMAHQPHQDDVYELPKTDELGQRESEPAGDGQTYALSELVDAPRRKDLAVLKHPGRWCLACGYDLTPIETGVCPRCEKRFNPENHATFSQEPVKEPGNWWLQPPRLAGYALIVLFIIGRLIINTAASAVGKGLEGTTGGSRASIAAGTVMSALGILCLIPWVIGGVLLALIGVSEHFAPKVFLTIALGAAFGLLFMLGDHPALAFIGLMAGGLAGFVYAWRAT